MPNALVHSLYQRLLVLFGAAFATMPIQEGMPHQRAPATGAISKRSQGDPRWIFLGLFVRRHLWHDSGRRRFNNLHVALRVFFSIELDLLLPCELNASVLLGVFVAVARSFENPSKSIRIARFWGHDPREYGFTARPSGDSRMCARFRAKSTL